MPVDYSPGVVRLMSALGGTNTRARAREYADLADLGDVRRSQADLNQEKTRGAIAARLRQAELDDPNAIADVLAALGGVNRQTASAFISGVAGASSPPGSAGAALAPPVMGDQAFNIARPQPAAAEIDPEVRARLGPIYSASRLGRLHGGKVHEVARASDLLTQGALRTEAAGAARSGGDPSAMNRLISAMSGKAYEPFGAGQHGPYSQETGVLANPDLYRADVGTTQARGRAATALAGERGAQTRQTNVETANLETAGAKEPGRIGGRPGARETAYQQKLRVGMQIYPNAEDASTPTQEAADYAAGRRRATYIDVSRTASGIAKNEGLTGADYAGRVRGLTEELLAAEKGDKSNLSRVRLRNATNTLSATAPRIMKLSGDKRTREIGRVLGELKAKGFDREEAMAILTGAGITDADGQ